MCVHVSRRLFQWKCQIYRFNFDGATRTTSCRVREQRGGDQEEEPNESFFSKETKKRRKIKNDNWLNGRWKI
jgi:predicted secreted protein